MAFTPRLELRQGQGLVMTPQLQQAIKLLQFSNAELLEFVEQELAENPMLEREDGEEVGSDGTAETDGDGEESEFSDDGDDGFGADNALGEDHVTDAQVDALDMDQFDNVWESGANDGPAGGEAFADWGSGGNTRFDGGELDGAQNLSQELSLRDHLLNQIQMEFSDPADRLIAVYLTDLLDEAARLPEDLSDAARQLGCTSEKIEEVIGVLHGLDPTGVYARNLAECWAIQLREKDRFDPAMQALLDNMELLKLHEYQKLAKACGVDLEDIQEMINEIWALNHRPADAFDQVMIQAVTPDILMRPGGTEHWIVELNSETLPRVLVNEHYYAEVSRAVRSKEDKHYLNEKFQSANWLVKSLHQRATTILKVASEIVKQQDGFFRKGVTHLKPLVLRDIAEEIEMHESTVSRVTSNKYIQTPRGLFELKYFFTAAIGSANGGDAHSAEAVRHRIRLLIDAEKPSSILSDDKLVDLLNADGIDIARRTVAKYRESMHIPSSVQRRREKRRAALISG